MITMFFKFLYYLLVLARVLSFNLFLISPLLGWSVVYVLDLVDYAAAIRGGITFTKYEWVDKTVDVITRFYMVYTAIHFGWPWFLLLIIVLYRLIGDILLLVKKERKYLFIFPNIIEFFFPLYCLYMTLNLNEFYLIFFFVFSLLLKLIHEYVLHVKNWIDPWSLNYIKKHKQHKRSLK